MYCQSEGSAFDWGGAGYALEAIKCMVYPVCTRRFIVIVLHLVVTINVMFATIHSLHTDGSPYMIFTNQIGVGLQHERDHHT